MNTQSLNDLLKTHFQYDDESLSEIKWEIVVKKDSLIVVDAQLIKNVSDFTPMHVIVVKSEGETTVIVIEKSHDMYVKTIENV